MNKIVIGVQPRHGTFISDIIACMDGYALHDPIPLQYLQINCMKKCIIIHQLVCMHLTGIAYL